MAKQRQQDDDATPPAGTSKPAAAHQGPSGDDVVKGVPPEEMSQNQREAAGRIAAGKGTDADRRTVEQADPRSPGPEKDAADGGTDFDAMTKDELKAYADEHGVEGVTSSMTKDEMVKAVKGK